MKRRCYIRVISCVAGGQEFHWSLFFSWSRSLSLPSLFHFWTCSWFNCRDLFPDHVCSITLCLFISSCASLSPCSMFACVYYCSQSGQQEEIEIWRHLRFFFLFSSLPCWLTLRFMPGSSIGSFQVLCVREGPSLWSKQYFWMYSFKAKGLNGLEKRGKREHMSDSFHLFSILCFPLEFKRLVCIKFTVFETNCDLLYDTFYEGSYVLSSLVSFFFF